MESQPCLSLHSLMKYTFSYAFFTFTILFSFFSLLLFLVRLSFWCNCDVCSKMVSRKWVFDFDNLCDWYTHLLRKSSSATIHIHVFNNTITANSENVEYMLKTNFDNYPKGKPFSSILGDLLGRGIFNVDGDSWKFQRKMASFELGSVSIRSFAFNVATNEINNRLLPLLCSVADNPNQFLDLQDVFRRFGFDNICRFSFGIDPGCLQASLPTSDFAAAFDLASKLSAQRALYLSPIVWKIKRFLNIGSEKDLKEAISVVNDLAYQVINEKRRLGVENHQDQDLLSRFMSTVKDDSYLKDIVVSFLLAGRDTVASGLTSFFFLLTQHPEVELVILKEANRVMKPDQERVSYEQLREMPYLQAALYECLRLYPPVQFDSKFAQEDDILPDGTFVKKGTRVTYHPYAMGRMEEIWGPDCLEFKPERWLTDGVFSPQNPYKFPVFQAGLRVCLGKEMALVEMKCVVLSLIRNFRIVSAKPGSTLKFAPGLTATVSGGFPVQVRYRENSSVLHG